VKGIERRSCYRRSHQSGQVAERQEATTCPAIGSSRAEESDCWKGVRPCRLDCRSSAINRVGPRNCRSGSRGGHRRWRSRFPSRAGRNWRIRKFFFDRPTHGPAELVGDVLSWPADGSNRALSDAGYCGTVKRPRKSLPHLGLDVDYGAAGQPLLGVKLLVVTLTASIAPGSMITSPTSRCERWTPRRRSLP
jgi:hypothetical protein